MVNNFFTNILPFIACATIFYGCANIQPPTGGGKDTINPKVNYEESQPSSYPIKNYSGNELKLSFNEYIQASNLNKELLFSTNLDIDYDYTVHKNTFILKFKDDLPDSTTITLHFREGIQDITERNPVQNLKLTLSTGPYIDSLSISGKVINALTSLPSPNTIVALYPADDTLTITENEPWYYTKTKEDGTYTFTHLPPRNFKLFALIDKNNNLIYDDLSEEIAFLKDTIKVSGNQIIKPLKLFKNDTLSPRLIGKEQYSNVSKLKFTKTIDSIYLPDYQYIKYKKVSKDKKEFTFYRDDKDSLDALLPFTYFDSLGRGITDTLEIFKEGPKYKTNTTYTLETSSWRSKDDTLRLLFEEPIVSLDTSRFTLGKDSIHIGLVPDESASTRLKFVLPYSISDSLYFIIPDSAIQIFGPSYAEGDSILIMRDNPTSYGLLQGKVITDKKSYILQLIDQQKKLVTESVNPQSFRFSYLKPGTYYFRVLIDEDNNGVYEYGNYFAQKQPEPIYVHQNKYLVKANWEIKDIIIEF